MLARIMNEVGTEGSGRSDGMPCGDDIHGGDQRFPKRKQLVFMDIVEEEEDKGSPKNSRVKNNISCSDESSSIGKDSELSGNSTEKPGDGEEVQSSCKGALDAMDALEEVLPIRRGISGFYDGKSKSFASLADVASLSCSKVMVKPDNAYARKRRNLLACSLTWDKNRSCHLRRNGGGISKKVTVSTRSTLAVTVAMNNYAISEPAGGNGILLDHYWGDEDDLCDKLN